jgi:hypothetical protein
MATDANGSTYQNRTLNFYGQAFGSSNVSITAVIDNTTVFSGIVPTVNQPLPFKAFVTDTNLLFSVAESPLFPTNWDGSCPMSVSVTGGYGVVLNQITCNYMRYSDPVPLKNSTIEGTTLTIGTISSGGTVGIGNFITGPGVLANTVITAGSGTTWTVNNSQSVPSTTLAAFDFREYPGMQTDSGAWLPGTSTHFAPCYNGTPTNSEGTTDPRTDVTVDEVRQVPPLARISTLRPWIVPTGSTIAYNLNVSLGNCAQA